MCSGRQQHAANPSFPALLFVLPQQGFYHWNVSFAQYNDSPWPSSSSSSSSAAEQQQRQQQRQQRQQQQQHAVPEAVGTGQETVSIDTRQEPVPASGGGAQLPDHLRLVVTP